MSLKNSFALTVDLTSKFWQKKKCPPLPRGSQPFIKVIDTLVLLNISNIKNH